MHNKDMYYKNDKTLLKKTEEDTNRKTFHVHGSEELILVKYTYYQNHLQNQHNMHQNTKVILHKIEETILNVCGTTKNTEYRKQFWEKRTNLEISRLQTILQSHNVKNSSVLEQTDTESNGIDSPELNPSAYSQPILAKGVKTLRQKRQAPQQMVLGKPEKHMQNTGTGLLTHTTHTN